MQVPTAFWPTWAEHAVTLLPVHHGLTAIRTLLDDGPAVTVARVAAREAAVAAAWFAVAALSFGWLARHAPHDGSI